jgi:Ser/Thr protein kinase RdoA (MazF antagonist)
LLACYHHAATLAPIPPPERIAPGVEIAARWQRLRARLADAPNALPELRGVAEAPMAGWVHSLEAFWEGMPAPTSWLWAHGDFTPYNLVYRDHLPVGLLDFGAVQWLPAAYDLAVALLAFFGPTGCGLDHRPPTTDHRPPTAFDDARPYAQGPTPNAQVPFSPSAFLAAYAAERPLSDAEQAALPMLMRHRRVVAVLWIAEECLAGRVELRSKLAEYFAGE